MNKIMFQICYWRVRKWCRLVKKCYVDLSNNNVDLSNDYADMSGNILSTDGPNCMWTCFSVEFFQHVNKWQEDIKIWQVVIKLSDKSITKYDKSTWLSNKCTIIMPP